MAAKKNRYRDLERIVTTVLGADTLLFLIFLISAGKGILWLKILCAIITILTGVLAIAFLYMTGELFRRRSLWMGVGFAAIILCVLVSLLCNFPSPNPLAASEAGFNPLAVGAVLLS